MTNAPAGWHPDPTGRYEHRYWDGSAWTQHVSIHGQPQLDSRPVTQPAPATPPLAPRDVTQPEPQPEPEPQPGSAMPPLAGRDATHIPAGTTPPDKVQRQAEQVAGSGSTGGGTVFTEPVLVVNQKAKLVEINNEYAVYNRDGTQVAAVRQVGQSIIRKILRAFTSIDQYLTQRLEVVDMAGGVLLQLTRPAKVFKSTVVVSRPASGEVGRIVQENMVGKIRFGLMVGGRRIGSINAENWRAWNFSIRDEGENEVARITKTWEGLAKTMFTTADNYVVNLHGHLDDPLLTLVVASALSVDTALKQDQRGLS